VRWAARGFIRAGWVRERRRAIDPQPVGDDLFVADCLRAADVSSFRKTSFRGISDMAKVLCVLYDDPVDGYPKSYPRDDLPKIERYPGGQTLPTPKAIDFKPGALLGSVSGELGLRKYLESLGHTLLSPPTRRDRIRASSVSFRTPRSSSRSLSGPPT
jgi:hypothetical protein